MFVFHVQRLPTAALQYELDLCKEDLVHCRADLEAAQNFNRALASHDFLNIPADKFVDSGTELTNAGGGDGCGDDQYLDGGMRQAAILPTFAEGHTPEAEDAEEEGGVEVMQKVEPSVVPTQSLPSAGMSSSLQVPSRTEAEPPSWAMRPILIDSWSPYNDICLPARTRIMTRCTCSR